MNIQLIGWPYSNLFDVFGINHLSALQLDELIKFGVHIFVISLFWSVNHSLIIFITRITGAVQFGTNFAR